MADQPDTGFEWDTAKAEANRRKHGIRFTEAQTIMPSAEVFEDFGHGGPEDRYSAIGFSEKGRMLSVTIAYRGKNIRIISARTAARNEADQYVRAKSQKGDLNP